MHTGETYTSSEIGNLQTSNTCGSHTRHPTRHRFHQQWRELFPSFGWEPHRMRRGLIWGKPTNSSRASWCWIPLSINLEAAVRALVARCWILALATYRWWAKINIYMWWCHHGMKEPAINNANRNIEKDLLHARIKLLLLFLFFSAFFRWFGSLSFLWHALNITIFDRKLLHHRVPGLHGRFVGQNSSQAVTNCLVVADFCWTPQSMTRFCLSTSCVFYARKHTVDSFPWVLWVLAGGQMSCNLETIRTMLCWMNLRLQGQSCGWGFPFWPQFWFANVASAFLYFASQAVENWTCDLFSVIRSIQLTTLSWSHCGS